MEIQAFARAVVESPDLATKLRPAPRDLTDDAPGRRRPDLRPGRSAALAIQPGRAVKVPRLAGFADPAQRARILHALANHELQAAELFAWALLAFPDAPPAFRRGLLGILDDEQRHTRMYIARVEALGARFGDFPVSGYFWNKVDDLRTPLHFVCAMSLTFENANLDHTVVTADAARVAGDDKTARVIEQVHRDEIRHVAFGWRWLERLKPPDQRAWDAYRAALAWPLRPVKARGEPFHLDSRRAAGLEEDFIAALANETDEATRASDDRSPRPRRHQGQAPCRGSTGTGTFAGAPGTSRTRRGTR